MTNLELKEWAKKEGISYEHAISIRRARVTDILGSWQDYMDCITNGIPEMTIKECVDELTRLQKALKYINAPPQINEVTQDMIDAVRLIPVDQVVQFDRGTAKCFNHEDNAPSAYWAKRVNKLSCPVCAKMWDVIDIKMIRDNVPFIEAVRELYADNH
jgi:hypothetical protein